MEDAWGMADERDRLAGGDEGFDQPDRIRVLSQIPHRAMAAEKNTVSKFR